MSSVGRPPEVDSNGEPIQKSLVNVTIPTKLASFLKKKGINRSRLFVTMAQKMFDSEVCDKCYGETIEETLLGWYCRDCNGNPNIPLRMLKCKECENCGVRYDPPYNMFSQSKDKSVQKGCWDCIPPEERS